MSGILLWQYDLPPEGAGRRWLEVQVDDDGAAAPDGGRSATLEVRYLYAPDDGTDWTIEQVTIPPAAIPAFLAALARFPVALLTSDPPIV